MRSPLFPLLLTASGLAAAVLAFAPPQGYSPVSPFKGDPTPMNPYETFVDHFSSHRPGTDTYLLDQFRRMYPNSSVTVSQDYLFNLFGYAAAHPDKIILKEMDEVQTIKSEIFIPAMSRRDGEGRLVENVLFAGYRVAFGNQEMIIYTASWPEGFGRLREWFIISDGEPVARKLLHDVSVYASTFSEAVLVFDQGFWRPDHNLWMEVQKASWGEVILDEGFKHRIQADYRSFFKSEKTYKDLAVPWKRGLILIGPPGNGKTVSVKAIMKDVKVPALYVKSLHSYGGDEFAIRAMFERARREAPCVLIMEDLDSLINDMNRSFFLNEVDGLEDNDGLLMIATTNHFDRLDPALSNRPSRFDRKYTFQDPSESERRQYAVWWQNKLKDNKDIIFPDSLLDKVARETEKFSFAYMKEAFVSALLTLAEDDDAPEHGSQFPTVLMEQIKFLKDQLDGDSMAASWSRDAAKYVETDDGPFFDFNGGSEDMMRAEPMERYEEPGRQRVFAPPGLRREVIVN